MFWADCKILFYKQKIDNLERDRQVEVEFPQLALQKVLILFIPNLQTLTNLTYFEINRTIFVPRISAKLNKIIDINASYLKFKFTNIIIQIFTNLAAPLACLMVIMDFFNQSVPTAF